MTAHRPRWLAPVVVSLAVIVAGCSSSSDGTDATPDGTTPGGAVAASGPVSDGSASSDAGPNPTTSATPADPAVNFGSSADAALLTHLYALLGVGTPDEAAWSSSGRASEADIAACMTESGFQYTPSSTAGLEPRLTMPPEEFAARYGFGATMYRLGLIDTTIDPNFEHKTAMSSAEQIAYDQAQRACGESAPPENPAALLGPGGGGAMTVALDQYRATVATDDRVVAAVADWKACLAAAGFIYDNPNAMRDSFGLRQSGERSKEELQALHNEEVIVATANLPCEAPYTDTYRQVVADRFPEFKTLHDTALATGAAPAANG